jgi:DNA-binding winged helix-turn-helix (wHTH) protein/predicted Zn-dependent protease
MKLVLGRLTVDDEALVVALNGRPIPAAPKVVELILALGERRGEVLTKEVLIERLWPQGYADDATLWQVIYLARKLLAKTGQAAIETHPRRGYRIVCEEGETQAAPAMPPARRRNIWSPAVAAMAIVLVGSTSVYTTVHRDVQPPLPSAALRAYNLGRYYLHQGTVASIQHGISELESVVRDAPANALGYADLAEAEVLFSQQSERGRRQTLERATTHANVALRIDPKSAAAQTALAAAAFYSGAPVEKVDASFKRAIALDDGYALAHMYYGEVLLERRDLRGAYVQLHRATDIDPSLGDANVLLALVAYKLGDPRTAIHYAHEGLGFGAADKLDAYQTLGYAYLAVGQPDSALHAFRQLRDYVPQASAAGITYVQSRVKARR